MKILIVTYYQNIYVEGSYKIDDAKQIEPIIYEKAKMYLQNNDKVVFIKDICSVEGTYEYNMYGRLYKLEKENLNDITVLNTDTPACFSLLEFLSNLDSENVTDIEICGINYNMAVIANYFLSNMILPFSNISIYNNATIPPISHHDSFLHVW